MNYITTRVDTLQDTVTAVFLPLTLDQEVELAMTGRYSYHNDGHPLAWVVYDQATGEVVAEAPSSKMAASICREYNIGIR